MLNTIKQMLLPNSSYTNQMARKTMARRMNRTNMNAGDRVGTGYATGIAGAGWYLMFTGSVYMGFTATALAYGRLIGLLIYPWSITAPPFV
ncbi:hypothetical protein [Ferviditalea candida]|uniref:Uncharacterized protein n=1 Tax=Ferviditalea candida TaxID=3108399 RepID=A0ABU5ZGE4_9BACL|nr:hypothetical protein [Paenibacillaceae bacterium T2]